MINDMLNQVYDDIQNGDVQKGMEQLFLGLKEIKVQAEPSEWDSVVKTCLTHPLKELIHSDPFTQRSFEKPRGYAGDAVLLDMIYFPQTTQLENVPDIGKQIFAYTTNAPASKAVRYRKDLLAKVIDEMADTLNQPKIMSVACGHLREAEISTAVKNRSVRQLVAMDYDQSSLSHIKQRHSDGNSGILPLQLSVRDILKGKAKLDDDFDLIYSAGLYDYLNQKTARRLTAMLFDYLAPGGQLLIANFLPDIKDMGYMEAYMGWNLIFRDEGKLLDIAKEIPRNKIGRLEIFSEELENIVFLKISKSGR